MSVMLWPNNDGRTWTSWVDDVRDRRRAEFDRRWNRVHRRQLARDAELFVDLGGEA